MKVKCKKCKGTRVQGTTWIDLNTGKPTGDNPPIDDLWCPDCDEICEIVEEKK